MSDHESKPLPNPEDDLTKPLGFDKEESATTDEDGTHHSTAARLSTRTLNHPDFEHIRLTLDEICSDLQRDFKQILWHGRLAKDVVKYLKLRIVPKTLPQAT